MRRVLGLQRKPAATSSRRSAHSPVFAQVLKLALVAVRVPAEAVVNFVVRSRVFPIDSGNGLIHVVVIVYVDVPRVPRGAFHVIDLFALWSQVV